MANRLKVHEQETIFDEFYQSDRTAARGYGGMGLGLAITQRIITAHRGGIHVDSFPGGTVFTISLPAYIHEEL